MRHFVTLDDKSECVGVYCDGELHFQSIPEDLTHTWKHTDSLASIGATDVEFANLYCQGKSLDEVCPKGIKAKWNKINKRMTAYHSSFVEAKVDLTENCFFDLIPKQYLKEYCDLKTRIVKSVFAEQLKPQNYDLLKDLVVMVGDIKKRKITLNPDALKGMLHKKRARDLFEAIKQGKKSNVIIYDPFKTKTGRLAVKSHSFPILNLDKNFRDIVLPENDLLVELDYNAAEIRVLLALAGMEQPEGDIHQWHATHLNVSREKAKELVLSWLYGSKTSDIGESIQKLYDKEKILTSFYNRQNDSVTTPMGRTIKTDDFRALNHLVQSTTADMVFEQMAKVYKALQGTESFIKFCLHDSIVIDLKKSELDCIMDLVDLFSNTRFGRIRVGASAGKTFGSMKKLELGA
jgi:hypothetical protein